MDGASFLQTMQTASAGGFASPGSTNTSFNNKKPTQSQAWTLDNAGMYRDQICSVSCHSLSMLAGHTGTHQPQACHACSSHISACLFLAVMPSSSSSPKYVSMQIQGKETFTHMKVAKDFIYNWIQTHGGNKPPTGQTREILIANGINMDEDLTREQGFAMVDELYPHRPKVSHLAPSLFTDPHSTNSCSVAAFHQSPSCVLWYIPQQCHLRWWV